MQGLLAEMARDPGREKADGRGIVAKTRGVLRKPMIKVRPRPNEPVQQLMRRLKKLCEREGVLREMKRTAYYEKPSDRNRRALRKAKRRLQKLATTDGGEV